MTIRSHLLFTLFSCCCCHCCYYISLCSTEILISSGLITEPIEIPEESAASRHVYHSSLQILYALSLYQVRSSEWYIHALYYFSPLHKCFTELRFGIMPLASYQRSEREMVICRLPLLCVKLLQKILSILAFYFSQTKAVAINFPQSYV